MAEGVNQWERKRARTRALIVTSATDLLLTREWEDVTIEDIADEAGLVRTTVFNHFKTKMEVLEAVGLSVVEEAGTKVSEIKEPLFMHYARRTDITYDAIRTIADVLRPHGNLGKILWRAVRDELSETDPMAPIASALQKVVEDAIRFSYAPRGTTKKRRSSWATFDEVSALITHFVIRGWATGADYPRALWLMYDWYGVASMRPQGMPLVPNRSIEYDEDQEPGAT